MGSVEGAEGGGSEEGQAAVGATATPNAVDQVVHNDPYATEETRASTAQTEQVK